MRAGDRVRLAPVPLLVGFAFSLGGVLAAVFPTRQEYAQLADDRAPDAYSLAYLQVLTRANPSDEHLRLLYVRHLTTLGRYDEAIEALSPWLASRSGDVAAQTVQLDLLLARARAFPAGDPRRAEAFGRVEGQLRALLPLPQSPERLRELAGLALQLERPALAADYLERAAAAAADADRPSLLVEAARWRLASGDAPRASFLYRRAVDVETSPARAHEYAMRAVAALESDDRVGDAADLAGVYVATWPDDRVLLERAADLSSRCGRSSAARDYGRRAVALDPGSDAALERQVRRELATGDVRAALGLLDRLLERRPDDVALHRARARIAEWAGRPEVALDEWVWLLDHGRDVRRAKSAFAGRSKRP